MIRCSGKGGVEEALELRPAYEDIWVLCEWLPMALAFKGAYQ